MFDIQHNQIFANGRLVAQNGKPNDTGVYLSSVHLEPDELLELTKCFQRFLDSGSFKKREPEKWRPFTVDEAIALIRENPRGLRLINAVDGEELLAWGIGLIGHPAFICSDPRRTAFNTLYIEDVVATWRINGTQMCGVKVVEGD